MRGHWGNTEKKVIKKKKLSTLKYNQQNIANYTTYKATYYLHTIPMYLLPILDMIHTRISLSKYSITK